MIARVLRRALAVVLFTYATLEIALWVFDPIGAWAYAQTLTWVRALIAQTCNE